MKKDELLEVARKGTVVLMVGTLAGKSMEDDKMKVVVEDVTAALMVLSLMGVDVAKDVLDVAESRADQLVAGLVAQEAIAKAAQA